MCKKRKYDIFISYRRKWGALYARILQLKLQEKGYKVFLDYDELKDGHFDEKIKSAIKNSSLFIFMYSKDSLQRCANEDDWVRQEIECAISHGKHIIPVVPDREEPGQSEGVPAPVMEAIGRNQHSEIDYGKALDASVEKLIKDRIIPHVGKRSPVLSKVLKALTAAVVLILLAYFSYTYFSQKAAFGKCTTYATLQTFASGQDKFPSFFAVKARTELSRYDSLMVQDCKGYPVNIVPDISYPQLVACHSILSNMVAVEGGTFLMGADASDKDAYDILERPQLQKTVDDFLIGKYEVSTGEWCGIMNRQYDPKDEYLPMTDISWAECQTFVELLSDLTGLQFSIPLEEEWEYAARGGSHADGTLYAGHDKADSAAVYEKNSGGHPAIRNYARTHDMLDLQSNTLGLYDMSGNVEEWCRNTFVLYSKMIEGDMSPEMGEQAKVIRGGSCLSPAAEVRITSRGPKNMSDKSPNVGLRLVAI